MPELSDKQRLSLAKQSVLETLRTAMEVPRALLAPAEKCIAQLKSIQGESMIPDYLAQGYSVVLVVPHMGNWEYFGLYLGQEFATTCMYKPLKKTFIEAMVVKGRTRTGGQLATTDKKGVRTVVKSLKNGGVVCILPDQIPDHSNGQIFVPFMGETAATMTLIPSLLQRKNIKAVAGICKRLDSGGFEIIFSDVDERLYHRDTEIAARGLNATVESMIKHAPAQYQWEYKRFRVGPEGKRGIYS